MIASALMHVFASTACVAMLTVFAPVSAGAGAPHTDGTCLPATPTDPDGSYIVPGTRGGIVYRRVNGRDLHLDAWAPPAMRPRPGVIVVHGGGFTSGSRIAFVGQFLEMLAAAGYPWMSVDYRMGGPDRVMDAVEDVREAVQFARCRAGELGIDGEQLVLLGEDAGADLALTLALERVPGVRAAIAIGGLYRHVPSALHPPAPAVSGRPPRLLMVHGTDDGDVPPDLVRDTCARLRHAGWPCDVVPVAKGSHRPENWWPSQWDYKERIRAWLHDTVPPPVAAEGSPSGAEARPPQGSPLGPGLHKRLAYDAEHGLLLDAWLPPRAQAATRSPAVVLVHGGGWEAGDRVTYITPLFAPLARAGFAWFSVGYRLTPSVSHPEQIDDLRRAVAFLRANADGFAIDPRRLALVGESASGQMVMLLAAEDHALAGVVSFYGVYDLPAMVTDASPRSLAARLFRRTVLDDATRDLLRRHSPIHRAHRIMPPILLVHGTNERLWEQGVAMAARLDTLGVPHELVRLDGAPHGMENWEGRPEWQFYKTRLVEWLSERFTRRD